jgi:hypothetical protein
MREAFGIEWYWEAGFCKPPFIAQLVLPTGAPTFLTIKAIKGYNAVRTFGQLPQGTSWTEIGDNLITLCEIRYTQENQS